MSQFTSDNRSGAVPEVIAALLEANAGHQASYGDDSWTVLAADLMRDVFETDCDVYFVATGTAANSLALATLCQSYHSVICHRVAHIETDECGAPEFFSNGTKLLLADGEHGKLNPAGVAPIVHRRSDIHYPRPRVLSLTQATELGTLYSPADVAGLASTAKDLGLRVHMDGARFANAVAGLGCSPADLTWRAGVDVLCFGGTKNGMMGGEAVVFFDRDLSREFAYRCKQGGQLISKMRFVSAQWVGLLKHRVWLKYAAHANAMARLLADRLAGIGLVPVFPVQANSVFLTLTPAQMNALADRGWEVYAFIGNAARLMCSWDTTQADIEHLCTDLAAVAAV